MGGGPKEQLLPTPHLNVLHHVVQNQLKLLFCFCLYEQSGALFINDHHPLKKRQLINKHFHPY